MHSAIFALTFLWITGTEITTAISSGLLFTKRKDVVPQDLVKSRSRGIGCYNHRIALKFDRHLDNTAVDVPVNFRAIGKV